MSITINGTTNTITAASGLTIAGNTAITGSILTDDGVNGRVKLLVDAARNYLFSFTTGEGAYKDLRIFGTGGNYIEIVSAGTALTGLLDLSAATAGQIKFPATQNASSNANTLDDYEEGTWTPTIGSGGGTITTSSATGSYVKIGRMVHATVNITITNAGTGTGALTFTVPFTSNTAGNSTAGSGVETAAVGFTGTCYLGTNSVTVSAYKDGFTTPIGTGNGLIYSIVYQTA